MAVVMAETAATAEATLAATAAETGERTRSHQGTSMYSDLCTSTYPTFASLQIGTVCLVAGRVSSESTRARTVSLPTRDTQHLPASPRIMRVSTTYETQKGPTTPFNHAVEAIVLALRDLPTVPVACLTVLNICYHTVLKTLGEKSNPCYGPLVLRCCARESESESARCWSRRCASWPLDSSVATETIGSRTECMFRDMDSDDSAKFHNAAQLE
jgi:hypothetical protein